MSLKERLMPNEINMIAPAAFAMLAVLGLWIAINATQERPNSGLLLVPSNASVFSHLS